MKKVLIIIALLLISINIFSATIQAIDGNILKKITVISIKDGKAEIESRFTGKITIPLDNIVYISFDDVSKDMEGILISNYNLSGYVKEYNAESNEATVVTTSGEFFITDPSVIKFWNIRQNTIKEETKKDYSSKNYNIKIEKNTFYKGEIENIKNGNIQFNVKELGTEIIPIDNINILYRDTIDKIPDGNILLTNGILFKFKDLKYENENLEITLPFGIFNTNMKYVKSFAGFSKEISKMPYYFILNDEVRFYADIKRFNDKTITLKTAFQEHEISNDIITTFLKMPINKKMIIATSDDIVYGDYTNQNENYILKSSLNEKKITDVKIINKEKTEFLSKTSDPIYTLKINSEIKDFNVQNNKIYIMQNNMIKVFSISELKELESIDSKIKLPIEIKYINNDYITYNFFGELYYSKNEKNQKFDNQISYINCQNKKNFYVALKNGELYSFDIENNDVKKVFDYKEDIKLIQDNYVVTKFGKIYSNGKKIKDFNINLKKALKYKNFLYLLDFNNNVYIYNLDNNELKTISSKEQIIDLNVSEEYIFVSYKNSISILNKSSEEESKKIKIDKKIFKTTIYNKYLIIMSEDEMFLYKIFEN
ncbi:hypothetical protein OSSY52_22060 [Tepiditoga spiralis]|uniref:Uncharacterized protein n=1 Tax=Tepiditoga spiralis TaxID=2108365 RepID=A0A7G1G781_9BACT|nr:hypothetical protein [Tepiditoga spiralis]BBE32065.1 hypothetical protein OSSY52_22060 [Tepiditoga spiralis]